MIFNCLVVKDLVMVKELYEGPHNMQVILKKKEIEVSIEVM